MTSNHLLPATTKTLSGAPGAERHHPDDPRLAAAGAVSGSRVPGYLFAFALALATLWDFYLLKIRFQPIRTTHFGERM